MFHVIIARENRVSTPAAPRPLAVVISGQLHDIGTALSPAPNANILACIEWDMVSPFVVIHKGSIADYKMAYAGWPMIDAATWLAQQSAVSAI
jgi:hypothetical protein